MPSTSSFDITSEVDFAEVDNALNQARKEVGQRYDFKGATAEIDFNAAEKTLTLRADGRILRTSERLSAERARYDISPAYPRASQSSKNASSG